MDPFMSARSAHHPERIEEESLLPSCDDLINGVQPKSETCYAPPSYPCTTCWNKDGKTASRPGEQCFSCSVKLPFSSQAFSRRNSTAIPATYPDTYRLENDPFPRRASMTNIPESKLPSPPYYSSRPANQSPSICPTAGSGYFSPSYLTHAASPYQTIPIWGDGSSTPSTAISASKQATNDRHKLSEKHRRDANGAFVQVAEILRSGINVGVLAGCAVCIAEEQAKTASPSSSSFSGGGGSGSRWSPSPDEPAHLPPHKSKKPKNDKVQGSFMFHYAYLLHHNPERLGARLRGIREYAADLVKEKAYRLAHATTDATTRKWSDDKRADVVLQALAVMVAQAEAHGYDVAETPAPPQPTVADARKRKRDVDAEAGDRYRECGGRGAAPTPPSSAGSPASSSGRGGSRAASPFSDGDERMARLEV